MSSKQSCWEIYNKVMSQLNNGHALWEPAPLSYFKCIQPGDVGYIRTGCFHLLFSAGCPLGERRLGIDVPLTFEKLDVGPIINRQPRAPGHLPTNSVRTTRVRVQPPTSPPPASPVPTLGSGSSISFRLAGGQGAVLVTKYQTYREDIQRAGTFEKYVKEHHASWVAFARETGHGSDINPVIVTGVDKTRDFAMISYSSDDDGDDLRCEFTTSAPGVASASAWGTWHTTGFVYTNCGPQSCCPPTQTTDSAVSGNNNMETVSDGYNQCVFVRYYTMRKRLGIPKVVKAGAGPHDFGPGCREDEESPEVEASSASDSGSDIMSSLCDDNGGDDRSSVTSIETESDILIHNTTADGKDDFDLIVDYIFQNSDADSALIHHRDIALLREPGGDTDLFTQLLERRPLITVDEDGGLFSLLTGHTGTHTLASRNDRTPDRSSSRSTVQ
ncbi:hypothetical protein BDM02DRAFT_1945456 [Thelephora ganbajun]|uniref:Uncharacterized protein n=1 Tax=Thelephora ganbajun TaxID=370292 RepID=A0ACB6ZIA7_THEGA|nr:hypothetical protein BDM02DRAFT_1945456 [Thelephora ganbajun]